VQGPCTETTEWVGVTHAADMRAREPARRLLFLVAIAVLLGLKTGASHAQEATATTPGWLEPRALSVVELVGQVPEADLKGTIISSDDGTGIVVYESGTRVGNQVTLRTKIYPRLVRQPTDPNNRFTSFGCLGQMPHYDHMSSTVLASTLRVYDQGGAEVTSEIRNLFVTRMGTRQPSTSSKEPKRYPIETYGYGGMALPLEAEGLRIPTNNGCRIWIARTDLYPLTGVFTLTLNPSAQIQVLGTQRGTFQSYIGPGNIGIFQPLMSQLSGAYGWRDGRIPLSVPAGANYFLVRFPAMPGDPYTDSHGAPPYPNANRPLGGTYRLSRGLDLSADLTFSAAFPLSVAWRDADRAPGSQYLPLTGKPLELATPEYILPTGIPYNNCFVQGNCPPGLLQQIHETQMSLEIIYLKVIGPESGGQWIPLRMAGPAWSPSSLSSNGEPPEGAHDQTVPAEETPDAPGTRHFSYLPSISGGQEGQNGQEPDACPCGWFDAQGRMLGLVPGTEAAR
jgi:hypothetical protein